MFEFNNNHHKKCNIKLRERLDLKESVDVKKKAEERLTKHKYNAIEEGCRYWEDLDSRGRRSMIKLGTLRSWSQESSKPACLNAESNEC